VTAKSREHLRRNQLVRKVNPGIKPRFSTNKSNKMLQRRKSLYTAKVIKRSANESDSIHFKAQSAFSC
jgi:hypothetical protein